MHEYEKKILLSEKEYKYLYSQLYTPSSTERQINFYYDTDDYRMAKQGITCRIREKGGIYTTTVKSHNTAENCSIENPVIIGNMYDDTVFLSAGLKLHGILLTHRCVFNPIPNIEIAVDKNEYLGCVDYELEIEYPAEHVECADVLASLIAEMLHTAGCICEPWEFISRSKSSVSKSERFFRLKKAMIRKEA